MTINFCKDCKTILPLERLKGNQEMLCLSCGLLQTPSEDFVSSETINQKATKHSGVSNDKNIFATHENICKKCGYDKAEIIDMGIMYSDEDNLIFLKCGKCGTSERIGRKTS